MILPIKTWSSGDVLFNTDLKSNFDEIKDICNNYTG